MIHILVVDDDKDLNRLVCSYLNDSGFSTKGCLSVNEAYDEMYANIYDLIVSDIMMPKIDGFEFAETIRKLNANIPILFLSARDDLSAKEKGFRLGIDAWSLQNWKCVCVRSCAVPILRNPKSQSHSIY